MRRGNDWGARVPILFKTMYTFLNSTGLVESKNICLDLLAYLKKKLEIFEVMHLEHPPIHPTM
jgi:hypothetical protein